MGFDHYYQVASATIKWYLYILRRHNSKLLKLYIEKHFEPERHRGCNECLSHICVVERGVNNFPSTSSIDKKAEEESETLITAEDKGGRRSVIRIYEE